MGEVRASSRPRVINRTKISFQENAARAATLENATFLFGHLGVIAQYLGGLHAEKFSKAFQIPFGHRYRRDAAAVGALLAIDLFFNILGDAFQTALHKIVALQMGSETLIFG